MTKCVMETLRLWPVVPNGTFRQLSYDDEVKGPGGKMVKLPKGTLVQVTPLHPFFIHKRFCTRSPWETVCSCVRALSTNVVC